MKASHKRPVKNTAHQELWSIKVHGTAEKNVFWAGFVVEQKGATREAFGWYSFTDLERGIVKQGQSGTFTLKDSEEVSDGVFIDEQNFLASNHSLGHLNTDPDIKWRLFWQEQSQPHARTPVIFAKFQGEVVLDGQVRHFYDSVGSVSRTTLSNKLKSKSHIVNLRALMANQGEPVLFELFSAEPEAKRLPFLGRTEARLWFRGRWHQSGDFWRRTVRNWVTGTEFEAPWLFGVSFSSGLWVEGECTPNLSTASTIRFPHLEGNLERHASPSCQTQLRIYEKKGQLLLADLRARDSVSFEMLKLE